MTKEELIIENARLQSELGSAEMNDTRLRREFAKAFKWFNPKGVYDSHGETDPITPTWEQVFIKVGGLIERDSKFQMAANYERVEKIVQSLETRVENLEIENS